MSSEHCVHAGTICRVLHRLRYRTQARYALNDVTFDVQPAERVGIVGRTGSGTNERVCAARAHVQRIVYLGGVMPAHGASRQPHRAR